jgi:hypothetical protein
MHYYLLINYLLFIYYTFIFIISEFTFLNSHILTNNRTDIYNSEYPLK